jgi:regulatory protein
VWHKKGVKTRSAARRQLPPLNHKQLQELGLSYAGRYATTRAKLRSYLARKLRERGWDGADPPDLEGLAERFAELGYVNDAAFALNKAQGLAVRGYGKRRLAEKLRIAGVEEQDGRAAFDHADQQAVSAALRFAERRRLGPFAQSVPDPRTREKAVAAMVRAGHGFSLARAIAELAPGAAFDPEELGEQALR